MRLMDAVNPCHLFVAQRPDLSALIPIKHGTILSIRQRLGCST